MNNFKILKQPTDFSLQITIRNISYMITAYDIELIADKPASPSELKLRWSIPATNAFAIWKMDYHDCNYRGIRPEWHSRTINNSQLIQGIPAVVILNENDENFYSVFCTDDINPVSIRAGSCEENAGISFTVSLLKNNKVNISSYKTTLIIDERKLKINSLLQYAVKTYWPTKSIHAPEEAHMPLYSTWYSFHQELKSEPVLQQCKLAYELGCRTIIFDDGWQTYDTNRGYAYCGDWELCTDKINSMRELTEDIHNIGMKVMMWFSLPFIGIHSKNFDKFKNMLLDYDGKKDYYTLDPRFEEVRNHLITLYCKAVREWNIDGLKIDFIDAINLTQYSHNLPVELNDAMHILFESLILELKKINENIMVEFRQYYVTPRMHNYANIYRVADCPMDSHFNRINSIDLRMINTTSAIHSDMLMWNTVSSPEFAARQIISSIYCVPQISVLIDSLKSSHYEMLKFYLNFCIKYKNVLQLGELVPKNCAFGYTSAYAYNDTEAVHTLYSDNIVSLLNKDAEIVINGTSDNEIFIKSSAVRNYIIYDCCGNTISQGRLSQGINELSIPISGILIAN